MKNRLEALGLSKNEILVYLTLLRLGSAPVGKITEESGVHRRNVYDALERLEKKGLVGQTLVKKVKHFSAASPKSLERLLEDEKLTLEKRKQQLSSLIPELLIMQKSSKHRESMVVYKGANGIKSVLDDILKTSEENLVLGAHKPPKQIKNYLSNFHKRRVKLGVKDRLLFNAGDLQRAKKLSRLPKTEVRFLSNNAESRTCINIYGDKVAILMWSDPVAIMIENKEFANTFREYFQMLWKSARSIV